MPSAVALMVVTGIICAIYLGIGSSYLRSRFGSATPLESGQLIALVFAAAFAGQVRRLEVPHTALWSLALGVAAATLLVVGVLLANVAAIFVSAVLSGGSQGTGQLAGVTAIRDVTAPHRRRRGYGIGQAWAYGLSGGLVLMVGWASRLTDLSGSLVCSALVSGMGLGFAAAMIAFELRRNRLRLVSEPPADK